MKQHISDKQLRKFFQEHKLNGSIHYYEALGRKLRYISIGDKNLPTIFFVPGSPASVSLYKDYYADPQLNTRFRMLAVDRPGFGRSGYGKAEPSIRQQAQMIQPVVENSAVTRPLIICAASYGVPVASQLIIDHPNIADALVMDAPSLAPGEEKIFWMTSLIEHSFIKWLILPHHRAANAEKFAHTAELKKMLPLWKNIRIPVIYIQGEKDGMVYKTNASFAREHFINCPYLEINFIPGREHFITIKEKDFIKKKIIEVAEMVSVKNLQKRVS